MEVTPPARVWSRRRPPARFVTTRWSLVVEAAKPGGGEALSALCRAYWPPVHAFVQKRGLSAEDAADVTQGLFETLISRKDIANVDRARGKFRSWLLTCAQHYLYNWFSHRQCLTFGGKAVHVSAEAHAEELRTDLTPEREFERRWALTVLDRASLRLSQRYERMNKAAVFAHLHVGVSGQTCETNDKTLALLLGKSVVAIKVERHRLKADFKECIRAEVQDTLTDPDADAVEDEIRRLIDALST
jgi:RNA polymerase sigma-70 factor (ECF subfamily)